MFNWFLCMGAPTEHCSKVSATACLHTWQIWQFPRTIGNHVTVKRTCNTVLVEAPHVCIICGWYQHGQWQYLGRLPLWNWALHPSTIDRVGSFHREDETSHRREKQGGDWWASDAIHTALTSPYGRTRYERFSKIPTWTLAVPGNWILDQMFNLQACCCSTNLSTVLRAAYQSDAI